MIRVCYLLGIIFLSVTNLVYATNNKNSAAAAEEGLEYLLFEEIPVVVTASKKEQSLSEASSVVTVISKEEIKKSGCRTIIEFLKRIPGFFSSRQAMWPLLSSRGIVSDGNDNILFMIDGHAQNSILNDGYRQEDMLPTLEKIEKIEIIRGPGSVLWGSSAVAAIINVITKDKVSSNEKECITTGYSTEDKMFHANYLSQIGEDNGMFSFSYWKADGYNWDGRVTSGDTANNDWTYVHPEVRGNFDMTWGSGYHFGENTDAQKDGYELYSKLKAGENSTLKARVVQEKTLLPWDMAWGGEQKEYHTLRKSYLEFQNKHVFSDSFNIETTLYGDYTNEEYNYQEDTLLKHFLNGQDNQTTDRNYEELAFGGEVTGNLKISDSNDLKTGLKYIRTFVGPNRDVTGVSTELNIPPVLTPTSFYYTIPNSIDQDYAIYAEDTMKFNDNNTEFFFGGRYDKNDWRENKGIFLPTAFC